MRLQRRTWIALSSLLLFIAGTEFLMRGPVRALRTAAGFNDFLSPYIQSQAWAEGLDPYSPQVLLQLWPKEANQYQFLPREVANGKLVENRGIPTAYPITTLVLLSPLDLLCWNHAYSVWIAINVLLLASMIAALIAICDFSYRDPLGILLCAGVLALAPFHTGFVTANVTLVSVELGVIGMWAAKRRRETAAAILFGLAVGLKPQIGLCFLVFYFLRRRWRLSMISTSVLCALAGTGLIRLQARHVHWLADYLADSRTLLQTGVLGNFTSVNPTRFGLVNLQVSLYPIIGSVRGANDLSMAIGGALLIVWLILLFKQRTSPEAIADSELLDLSALVVISLLPVYHRFYDAALLVLPLCWGLVSFGRSRLYASLCLLLIMPFLIPGGTLLQTLEESGRIPASVADQWWWEAFIMAHQVWTLLFLSIFLLWRMASLRGSAGVSPPVILRLPPEGANIRGIPIE